jgi:hypothetical protein
MKLISALLLAAGIYYFFFFDESGCDKYASKYSCNYVVEKAKYDVYYWHNVYRGDPADERRIASVTGLRACRDLAVDYSLRIKERWSERSYVCMLVKDGRNMEKHRLIF